MTKIFSIIILVLGCVSAQSQTKGTDRFKSLSETHLSPYDSIPFRCVGPTVMSGRVVDIAWDPQNDHHFYVAYASGGLWETTNNGTSFHPIMDHLQAMTIGAIAVDWKNQKIWVGTGENNSSRSSYSGVGIYCTTNNGQTWTYKGLPESHHIGKIILHPSDPNKIWIGVLGHLYTPNSERGIYFSENGGESWTQQLFVDENTGCIDLEINPSDPTELFAAMWQRSRRAWNFEDGGKNSGVYHSIDGGKTWKKINTAPFPDNEGTGRIGLAFTSDGKNKYLYASIDNQNRRPEKPSERSVIKKNDFEKMTKEQFLALDSTQFASFLKEQYFPEALSRDSLRTLVALDKIAPSAIYDYLYDANEDLFNSPVVSLEVYQFNFENNSWKKTHEDFLDDVVYSYGYYFGVMEVDPSNPQKIYSAGVPIITSDDGGKTWYGINPANVHVDHHVIKIHPKNSNHIINGSDGGVQISYDGGKTFVNCNTPAVGQFYSVQVDQRSPYNVYGGLQDNGVWYGSSTNTPNRNWTYEGQYPFKNIMGGDGMQVQIDPRNNDIVYTGYQFGYYS
ncbi:MAG: WD40/YVTN/BNR-like repeat-containing protein, partial [Flavobacteriales bacterium]